MTTSYVEDSDYLEAFRQVAPAIAQLEPDEQDRRSMFVQRFPLATQKTRRLRQLFGLSGRYT